MPSNRLHIVDVFAQEKYAGNQLAVFHETDPMTTEQMQQLAEEMNYSESTFIRSSEQRDNGYDVRIFTPTEELQFAGHPTLGTAFVLREFVQDDSPNELKLNLGVGEIPVTVEQDEPNEEIFWMQQVSPSFTDTVDHALAARVLNLEESDIDSRYPVQLISTGLPTIIVPLRSLDAVQRAETNHEPYYNDLIKSYGNLNILLFAPETYDGHDLNARVFADCLGVPEDPATGSSNGCLAAYLVEHDYFDANSIGIEVEQGYEMNRPSLLQLEAERTNDGIDIFVGGRVIPVVEGNLL